MKYKKTLAIVVSLIASHFLAYPVGRWFESVYPSGAFITIGPFAGYLDGLFLSYVFISSLIVPIFSKKIQHGLYAALPVFVIDILLGAWNPQLWMDLILLIAGLGIGYTVLRASGKQKGLTPGSR